MADLDEIFRRQEAKDAAKAEKSVAKAKPGETFVGSKSESVAEDQSEPEKNTGLRTGRPSRRSPAKPSIQAKQVRALADGPLSELVVYKEGRYRLSEDGDAGYKGSVHPYLPRALIDYVRDKWSRRADLSPAQVNSLSIQSLLLFFLIREVDDPDARNLLVRLYDNPNRQTIAALMRVSDGLHPSKTDRQLLEELVERSDRTLLDLLKIRQEQQYSRSLFAKLIYGLTRAVSWLFLDRIGLFRSALPKTRSDVRAVLNDDSVTAISDALFDAGKAEEKRTETKRQTQMERTRARSDE